MKVTYQGRQYDITKSGTGYQLKSLDDPNVSIEISEDEYNKTGLPTIASARSMEFAVKAMEMVTLASEFGDELYPVKAGEIRAGDSVYIRPLRTFGNVIRIVGDKHLVETTVKDQGVKRVVVNPYWLNELEKRSKE